MSQAVGYNDQSYFSKVFKKYTGLSPRRWKMQFDKIVPRNWVKYQVN
ncbi:MAG: AraC family transcriptional regulator [Limnochordia bacterium]|nr:AraC family transcriptional regulator [Bacillota bacterium]HOB08287.1 AraC family transcriptional regulator [Limnochordia bacterium]NLH30542.1 helix-turn-helix transcriptional regulator [Bacillota bacterium]HPT92573.1 AraC family transcriptional regulator [Limnochordia bacterium]HPZ30529.1 AraC family transcriptional regulator [Limnochordia bacterium]